MKACSCIDCRRRRRHLATSLWVMLTVLGIECGDFSYHILFAQRLPAQVVPVSSLGHGAAGDPPTGLQIAAYETAGDDLPFNADAHLRAPWGESDPFHVRLPRIGSRSWWRHEREVHP